MVDYVKLQHIPSKIIYMVKTLYAFFKYAVADGQDTMEWFKVKTGVKQGCYMSGLLFLLVVDCVMSEIHCKRGTPE